MQHGVYDGLQASGTEGGARMTKGYSSAPWLNEDAEPAHLPLYLRIRRTIRSQIDSGAFTPGAAIPSESISPSNTALRSSPYATPSTASSMRGFCSASRERARSSRMVFRRTAPPVVRADFVPVRAIYSIIRACACSRRRFALRELTTPGCSRYRLKATYFR